MNKDELKEKVVDYASKVFFYCVKRCNSRIDAYQELYNAIYNKVNKLVPAYLVKQIPFIISAIFNTDRSIIITKAFGEGIIADDKTRKKFIYNGFILR